MTSIRLPEGVYPGCTAISGITAPGGGMWVNVPGYRSSVRAIVSNRIDSLVNLTVTVDKTGSARVFGVGERPAVLDRTTEFRRMRVRPPNPVAFTEIMLTGNVFIRVAAGDIATSTYFWLKSDRDASARRYDLSPFIVMPTGSFLFLSGRIATLQESRQIVQIFPTTGSRFNLTSIPKTEFFPQPYGLLPGGYYSLFPGSLTSRECDLLTILIDNGEITSVEGTFTLAAELDVELRYKLAYSDRFSNDLLYLSGTPDYVYLDEAEDQTVSFSPLGRFQFSTPPLLNFLALNNIFGTELVSYTLGDRAFQFSLTPEELGMDQLSSSVDFLTRTKTFAEYIATPLNEEGRLPFNADFIQFGSGGLSTRTWIGFSGIRGGVV